MTDDNIYTRNLETMRHQRPMESGNELYPSPTRVEDDPHKILRELQTHQVELIAQNEELRRMQVELEASRLLYAELYDKAPVAYCTLSEEGRILQANQTMASLLGTTCEKLITRQIRRFILAEECGIFQHHNQQLFATDEPQSCDLRMVKTDGTPFWVRLRSVCAQSADGMRICRTAFDDITESKRAEEALREQKEFFHLIAENLSDFIAVLDLKGRRLYNSPSYQQFFGATSELRHTDSFAEIHPDDREHVRQVFQETIRTGQGQHIEYRFLTADGSIRQMESRGSVIKDRNGRATRVVVVSHDVTERKQLQEQVRQMAFHDALTGLPNRRLLDDRLTQAMAAVSRSNNFGALMFLDLDNFKSLNDSHGHGVGDLLLIEAADRLKHCVREMDTVARFGGDEFVVMLSQLDLDKTESITQAEIIAEKLRVALAEPYRLTIKHAAGTGTTVEHYCPASIGVALFHNDASQADVLKRADSAMYLAKQAGGNRVWFCGTQMACMEAGE